jgi:flagellin-like protein
MKKAISPMVATVLLIGFTIAVGAILSVWFTTFTRTQTAAVQSGATCVSNMLYLRALSNTTNSVDLLLSNNGADTVTVNSVIVTCSGNLISNGTLNPSSPTISPGSSQRITAYTSSACSSQNNIGIIVQASCSKGGTTSTQCPEGTCFGP